MRSVTVCPDCGAPRPEALLRRCLCGSFRLAVPEVYVTIERSFGVPNPSAAVLAADLADEADALPREHRRALAAAMRPLVERWAQS